MDSRWEADRGGSCSDHTEPATPRCTSSIYRISWKVMNLTDVDDANDTACIGNCFSKKPRPSSHFFSDCRIRDYLEDQVEQDRVLRGIAATELEELFTRSTAVVGPGPETTSMSDERYFPDTSVPVYANDSAEQDRRNIAASLVTD